MKKFIHLLGSALLLATVATCDANIVTGSFSGIVTGTNGVLHGSVQLGDAVSGAFGYDPSFLTSNGSVTLADHSAYLHFGVDGTGIGVGANNLPPTTTYVTMSIGADGLPVSSYVFNGVYTGSLGFSGGTGSGGIFNDVGPSGGVWFSVTSFTVSEFNAPDVSATCALMGFALVGLAGFKRLAS